MGQYYYVVNMDKQQYLHPHRFDDGLKATELASGYNTMRALALLLTRSDEGGGGDFRNDNMGIVGSWAGDKIWIVGDYDSSKLYEKCNPENGKGYEEMSPKVIPLLKKEQLWVGKGRRNGGNILTPDILVVNTARRKYNVLHNS